MKKYEIVRTSKDFQEVIKSGKCIRNHFYNIYIRKNNLKIPRFGIAVSKKQGNAVYRNKQKRRMRMLLTSHKKEFANGFDYIIIMKEKTKEAKFIELEIMLLDLCQKGAKNEI